MKTLAFLILLSTSVISSELTDLQENYAIASAKALEPVNKIYVTQLQKLLQKYSKEGNIDEVSKITNELKKFISLPTDNNINNIERLFVDKKWRTPFGTTFWFQKRGQGIKTTGADISPFTWRLLDNNIVEYNGRVTSTEPIKTEYIKFISKKEAYIGKDINKIDVLLIPNN